MSGSKHPSLFVLRKAIPEETFFDYEHEHHFIEHEHEEV